MILFEGAQAPQSRCIGCLKLVDYDEWNEGDGCCVECAPHFNDIADNSAPRVKD